jgi:acetaldehyde dehydrogenase/alcohol dehydrogenase
LALESIRLLFKYLPSAYKNGANDPKAREKVHYAATMAGMAFANSFLGVCHSVAHQLGATCHVPHGLANALMISHVNSLQCNGCSVQTSDFFSKQVS